MTYRFIRFYNFCSVLKRQRLKCERAPMMLLLRFDPLSAMLDLD